MANHISRESFLRECEAKAYGPFEFDGLPEPAYVRVLSGKECAQHETYVNKKLGEHAKQPSMEGVREHLIVRALSDEHGARLLEDNDLDRVAGLPSPLVKAIYDRCREVNGMLDDDELAKNSATTSTGSGGGE